MNMASVEEPLGARGERRERADEPSTVEESGLGSVSLEGDAYTAQWRNAGASAAVESKRSV
jgi:hypothetical protein